MAIPRLLRAAPLVLLVLGVLPAQPAASEPEMAVVEVLGERPFAGRVTGTGPTHLEVVPAGGETARKLPLERVIEVRFPLPAGQKPAPASHRATLMDGSVLNGTLSGAEEESFQFAVAGVGKARLPFEALRTFQALPPKAGICSDQAARYGPEEAGDVVHLQRGDDKITGMLMDADATRVTFEDPRGRTRRIAWPDIRVMHLENDDLKATPGVRGEVELLDGSRFVTAKPPVLSGGMLRFGLRAEPKAVFSVPMRSVRALRYTGGAFDYASVLPHTGTFEPLYPVKVEISESLEQRWNRERVDRQPGGCPLRLAGKRYRFGYGVRPKSVIRIEIGGRYASFQTLFGIDDSARETSDPAAANVDARVIGDGKVLWEKKGVTLEGGPHRVGPIDTTGVAVLELVVDFGKGGYTADHGTWANPILVRK